MKISTSQLYSMGVQSIDAQQQALAKTQAELSSGKRINMPSDDPAGMARLLNVDAGINTIDQFTRNSDAALNSLGLEETVLGEINTSLLRVRELVLQGNNASYSSSDRQSLAQEIRQRLDEITALGNTRDAAGNYIFAGNTTDTSPFTSANGTMSYRGDQGDRTLRIGAHTSVNIGDSGDDVFLRIRNGDGRVQVAANSANSGTVVLGAFSATSAPVDSYTIGFVAGAAPGEVTYEVRDSGSALIASGGFNSGDSISFAGITVQLTGAPAIGDQFDVQPAQNQSVFTTIQNVVAALENTGVQASDEAYIHSELARGLADIDQAMSHFNTIRASVGSRLNAVESTESLNQDLKLHLETIKSETSDLDFVEAISRFNRQLTSLEAAQQAFAKATQLSLFRFL